MENLPAYRSFKEDQKKQQSPEKRLEAKKGYETCIKLINEDCANHMGKAGSVNYADNFFLVKFWIHNNDIEDDLYFYDKLN